MLKLVDKIPFYLDTFGAKTQPRLPEFMVDSNHIGSHIFQN